MYPTLLLAMKEVADLSPMNGICISCSLAKTLCETAKRSGIDLEYPRSLDLVTHALSRKEIRSDLILATLLVRISLTRS
jgi:hypothetical protein